MTTVELTTVPLACRIRAKKESDVMVPIESRTCMRDTLRLKRSLARSCENLEMSETRELAIVVTGYEHHTTGTIIATDTRPKIASELCNGDVIPVMQSVEGIAMD